MNDNVYLKLTLVNMHVWVIQRIYCMKSETQCLSGDEVHDDTAHYMCLIFKRWRQVANYVFIIHSYH